MEIRQGVTYDDVLLVPKHSTVQSRRDIDTSVNLGKGVILKLPIIPANMKSISGAEMARLMVKLGGLAILHRFNTIEEECHMFKEFVSHAHHVGASVGVKEEEYKRADALVAAGCKILCVDVAHGDHTLCEKMVQYLAAKHKEVLIIAGNVATAEGALRLWKAGADVVKVGVGPGSLCTTRIETGNGMPQLTAIMDVFEARKKHNATFSIIADGGIRNGGDIVKALCFSEAVMTGNILAGTEEAPGMITTVDGQRFKQYEGSSTHKTNHIEGVTSLVREKGSAESIILRLMEGVRSGFSYQGAHNLKELQRDPHFILISHAGLIESKPHGLM